MTDRIDKTRARPTGRRFSPIRPPVRRAPEPAPDAADEASPARDQRVAKVMARAGLCSRRDAEAWIKAGRVAINGATIEGPAVNVGPDDVVTVDGAAVGKAERTRLFLFHKPRGLVTTAKDPEGRDTVFDALPTDLPRVVTVGRLDINTEGLMLLTNDGGLARTLELPATGWLRRYRVRANGDIDQARLDALREGVSIDGVDYAGIEATLDRSQGANAWLTMGLREGKNREIKKVLEHLGMAVNRLIRVSFGPFQLGDLAEGAVEEVKTRVLRDQLGAALAERSGVDFEGPVTAAVVTREVHAAKADERRDRRSREAPPRPAAKPEHSVPTTRQHVSSLRATADAEAAFGPRRRTARTATEDRRGRAVAVERVTATGPKGADRTPQNRNARRFEQQRDEAAGGPAREPARSRERPDGARPRTDRRPDAPAGRFRDRDGAGERPRFKPRPPGERHAAPEGRRGPPRDRAPEADTRPARPGRGPGRPPARPRADDLRPSFGGGGKREDRAGGAPKARGRSFGGPDRPSGSGGTRFEGGGKPPRSGPGGRPPRSDTGGGRPPRSGPGGGGRPPRAAPGGGGKPPRSGPGGGGRSRPPRG